MKQFFVLFTVVLFLTVGVFAAEIEQNMVVKIHFQDKNLAYVQLHPLHIAYEDVGSNWARALVKPSQLNKIQEYGYSVEVLYEDARIRAAERKAAMSERWTGYSSMVTQMQNIANAHPDIVRLHTFGQTVQGRTEYAMEITDNPDMDETDEAEVRMAGNIHGDEYISFELMGLLMEYLTDNYGTIPAVTNLVDNREIWVIPSINPDGHELGTRYNANGVDMNRNHGYMWNYEGSGPFSEIELQNFRENALQRNYSMSLSFHGETQYFNYCWNFTGENAFDKTYLHAMGNVYTSYNGYTNTEGYDWYQTNGDTNDWSYGCRGDFDTTIETPGYSEGSITTDWNGNRDAMLYIIEMAAYGISGVVTDTNSGNPLEALVTVAQHPIMVYTDPLAGDYHRPLQAGNYDITVWANGYAPATVMGIHVDTEQVTNQDVELVPNYEYYAMHVCWVSIDDYYESNASSWHEGWPHLALGPPDGVPGSLGKNCDLAFDMGEGFEITDGPGTDFIVYEADVGDGDEGFTIYGSTDTFLGPWVQIGTGSGTTEFDLSSTSLTSVRYLKIEDDGDGQFTGNYPGYDLDAIGTVEILPGCGVIALDATSYTCDSEVVSVTLVDMDLNSNPEQAETVDITITSDSNPTGETVTMTETADDSDTFMGSIMISETQSGSGYLLVDRGDTIMVTYHDADCQGTPQDVYDTAFADCADPQLSYYSHLIDDSAGDLDGVLDPDETVYLPVTLTNVGNEAAQNVYADLTCNMPQYITIIDSSANFPDINPGANGQSIAPHFEVMAAAGTPEHTMVTFTLTMVSDDSMNSSDFMVEVTSSNFIARYNWNMDTDPGWDTNGQWAWGVPQGNSDDPSSGFTGSTVYGYNLAGAYANSLPETNLTSNAIDCSNMTETEIRFHRWLGVESSSYDHASFQVSNNNSTWHIIWEHSGDTFTDPDWQALTYDISNYADDQPTVYLRWVMGSTDTSVTYCGWNIDDVEIWGYYSAPAPTATPTPMYTATPIPTETPVPCVYSGDVDNNGSLTPADALLSFEIYLGSFPDPTETEACAADCNGSGTNTPSDALCIFQNYLSGACACVESLPGTMKRDSRHAVSQVLSSAENGELEFVIQYFPKDKTAVLRIELQDNEYPVRAWGMKLSCSDNLEYLGSKAGSLIENWEAFGAGSENGTITLGAFDPTSSISTHSNGTIAELTFSVSDSSNLDITSDLNILSVIDDLSGYQWNFSTWELQSN